MLQVSVYAGDLAETQHHCNGIPLALSEGMGPEANLPETSRRECKYLSVILASQPVFSGCCRVCQCSATPRQSIKTDFEVFEKVFPAQFGISWPHVLNQWRSDSMVSYFPGEPILSSKQGSRLSSLPMKLHSMNASSQCNAFHLRWNKAWQKKVQTTFLCICYM